MVRREGKILKGEELKPSGEKWTRKPFTRKEFNELCEITPGMNDKEIEGRIRATSFGDWQPYIKIGNFIFEYKDD